MNMISVTRDARRRRRWTAVAAAAVLALGLAPTAGASPTSSAPPATSSGLPAAAAPSADPAACTDPDAWASLTLDGAEVTGVRSVWNTGSATALTPAVGFALDAAPFCEVEVSLTHGVEGGAGPDDVHVWVWLPQTWNGRMQSVGGGGTQATNGPRAMRPALAAGYAVVASDSGVRASRQPNIFLHEEGGFDWQLFENWSHRGVRDSALAGEQVVAAHYGEEPAYSYWNGCSNGGRQGLAMAQRDPDLFDGVLAAAPALYGADRLNMSMSWPAMIQQDALGGFLPTCKLQAMSAAVLAWCDGDDGVRDGLLGVPTACDYRAALDSVVDEVTPCGEITREDADIAARIYEGPRTPDGGFVWYGLSPGVDLAGGVVRAGPSFAFQNFAFADTSVDWTDYTATDLVTSVRPRFQGRLELLATANPSLDRFRRAGGKLLMWHGEADGLFSSDQSIHYYEEVARLTGERTDDYFRLFLAPGVDHCSGGTGPEPVDPLAALVSWVEQDQAPTTLLARTVDRTTGDVLAERNLCRYPLQPQYRGGPTEEAGSFDCVAAAEAVPQDATTLEAAPLTGPADGTLTGRVRVSADSGTPTGWVDLVSDGAVVASHRLEDGSAVVGAPASALRGGDTATVRYRGYGAFAPAEATVAVRPQRRTVRLTVTGPATWRHGHLAELALRLPGVTGAVRVTGPGFAVTAQVRDGRGTTRRPRTVPAGTHRIAARWPGDALTGPAAAAHAVTVRKSRTTARLRATVGREVVLRVRARDGGTPSGKVRFTIRTGSTVRTVTVRLTSRGTASVTLPRRGVHRVAARYLGGPDHAASTAPSRVRVG